MKRISTTVALVVIAGLGLVACADTDGPAENLGEEIDDAVNDAGDQIEDVADEVREAADEIDEAARDQ